MITLTSYSTAEKASMFDEVYQQCLAELNERSQDIDEHDEHYFWVTIMKLVLNLNEEDWNKHNKGQELT